MQLINALVKTQHKCICNTWPQLQILGVIWPLTRPSPSPCNILAFSAKFSD